MPTPATVTGLTVTSRAAAAIGLSWAAASNAVAYEVHRAPITNGVQGTFAKVNATTVSGTTFTDNSTNSTTEPAAGGLYSYKVRGVGSLAQLGAFSGVVSACAAAAITRVPGFQEEDIAPIFCDPSAFGSVAIWHKTGADDIPVRCIFDAESSQVDPDTGQIVMSLPEMWAATADLVGLAKDEQVEFCGLFYRVKTIQPDGSGLTVVELSKDRVA
jgi:hypothetical protein